VDDLYRSGIPSEHSAVAIQVLSIPDRIKHHYLSLIRSSNSDILLVFPTVNAILREYKIGVMDELKNAVKRGVKIRILAAEDDFIKEKLDALRASGIVIRRIESPAEAKFKMLIVDRKMSLVVETKDDSKALFAEAVGLAILASSKETVLPSVTIFESFWRETELYERARESDRIKDEFVNIAAHELRNPIMPILSGVDLLKEKLQLYRQRLGEDIYSEFQADMQMTHRNALKLLKLSEDILQVSRIESGTFTMHFEYVDLISLIKNSIADVERRYAGEKHNMIKLLSQSSPSQGKVALNSELIVYCDSSKIGQTLFNVIDNAMKFTEKGDVEVILGLHGGEILIQVRDSGPGIDPDIKERLFEKFATKSSGGTGLGLYLSRKIVEAHGGRIWGDNNQDGVGTTFSIILPHGIYQEPMTTRYGSVSSESSDRYKENEPPV
jgi:signal transduction histidine kinase